jgi:acid phosphatase
MKLYLRVFALALCLLRLDPPAVVAATPPPSPILWPSDLPVYDHVVIVVEENKGFEQIIDQPAAPYINQLRAEGAHLTRMFAEEHHSQGNYFWLFSGSNQGVRFLDRIPEKAFTTSNLAQQLGAGAFKGYSEDLPKIGSIVEVSKNKLYARKHVPWISFANVPHGETFDNSANLRLEDFPTEKDFSRLPKVSFVIPNLEHDMHNGKAPASIQAGDRWLKDHLDAYYQWAKQHNSLLIITFDENDHASPQGGLTNPAAKESEDRNRIATIFAGAHVKPGFVDDSGVTHVNILRTLESMYKLQPSGAQQKRARAAGIADDFILVNLFERVPQG